jgi:uncharacterized lipoprotein YmbA
MIHRAARGAARCLAAAQCLAATLLLAACASEPDHFYTLNVLPEGTRVGSQAPTAPTVNVLLSVAVPALVNRPEMIVSTSNNGVAVLEHQRWAVSFSDQVLQTLARDLERRRSDVLVADRAFDRGTTPPVKIKVDILRLSARRAGRVSMQARWRVVDAATGVDLVAGDVFDLPVDGLGYEAIATAYSEVLSQLAAALAAAIPSR